MTNDWTDRLSEYLDGALTPAEQAACEAWLATNAEGRALLEELRRVVAKAKTLPDVSVPESVWGGISAGIGARSLTRSRDVVATNAPRRLAASPSGRRWSFTPLQVMAAAVALLVIGGGVAFGIRIHAGVQTPVALGPAVTDGGEGPAHVATVAARADRSYDRAVEQLQQVLDANRSTLDTSTVRVLERSLTRIDAALAEAQQALANDPRNPYLNDHLARIKRKKLDLLRQSAALVRAS